MMGLYRFGWARIRQSAIGGRRSCFFRLPTADCRLPLILAAALLLASPALAVEPGEMLADPALEARARLIASELRCLVCQNQSIDDSDAPLAKDLRLIVREKLEEGASDEAVRAFVVARYGDFVLLRPPFKLETLALWGAPLIALAAGVYAIFVGFRRGGANAPKKLTDAERARLRELGVAPPSGENGGEQG